MYHRHAAHKVEYSYVLYRSIWWPDEWWIYRQSPAPPLCSRTTQYTAICCCLLIPCGQLLTGGRVEGSLIRLKLGDLAPALGSSPPPRSNLIGHGWQKLPRTPHFTAIGGWQGMAVTLRPPVTCIPEDQSTVYICLILNVGYRICLVRLYL